MRRIKYVFLFILILLISGSVSNKKFITSVDIDKNVMEGFELPIDAGKPPVCLSNGTYIEWYSGGDITVAKGDTKNLYATAFYCNDKSYSVVQNYTYTSNNNSIVTVNSSGDVTGVNYGSTSIKVVASQNGKSSTVTYPATVITGVTGFEFGQNKYTVKVGESVNTSYSVATHANNLGSVNYSIEDTSIATVDSNGKVTGVSAGTTTLTVSGSNGDSTTVPIEVIVPITEVVPTNTKDEYSLGESLKLDYTLSPANATPRNMTWKSSDSGVATVSEDGTVTIISPGEAIISVETEDGDEFEVTTIRVASASNNAVDPADNNNNTDATNNNVPDTVDNPGTGLFLTLVFGFGLCFILLGCYYLSNRFRMIRKI